MRQGVALSRYRGRVLLCHWPVPRISGNVPSHRQAVRLQDVIHAHAPQPHSQGAPACRQDPRMVPALGGRTPLRERLIVPWGKGQSSSSLGQVGYCFPLAETRISDNVSFRKNFIDEAGQETPPQRDKAATRSDGRHDDPARGGATTPETGGKSVVAPLRRAAGDARLTEQRQRQQAARVKARVGSDRGATECREAPRGRRRRTEQRFCAHVSGKGRGREDKTSTSEQIGEM